MSSAESETSLESDADENNNSQISSAETSSESDADENNNSHLVYPQAKRKLSRNCGQTYTTVKKKVIPAKQFDANFNCCCRKKCATLLTVNSRKVIFENFWKISDFKRQNAYLCGMVVIKPIAQRRPRCNDDSKRPPKSKSTYYFLQTDEQRVNVCKTFFLKTFDVSDGRVMRAVNKIQRNKSPGDDERGKSEGSSRQLLEDTRISVMQHISSFPSFQSHYTRSHNPNRKYLNPMLNVKKMYDLYVEQCTSKSVNPVKLSYYRNIFNSKFNLHFHVPRKDTCQRCDSFKMQLDIDGIAEEDRNSIIRQHEEHLVQAERARQELRNSAAAAKADPSLYACSFDLEKALAFPVLSVSVAYYKRNMYCYNLGINDISKDSGYFNVWDETIGKRGSQEVAACLIKHFTTLPSTVKRVVMYSDTCTGQNRNIKVALSMLKFVSSDDTSISVIDHKFLVLGHSYLPNDSDFASVETEQRGKPIYIPDDWYNIMAACRRQKKFIIQRMNRSDFLCTKSLEKAVIRRTKNVKNEPVNWLKIQWLQYQKDAPFSIFYKNSLEAEEFSEISLKGKRGRQRQSLSTVVQDPLYPNALPVTAKKKADMLDLLPYIPPIYHTFFTSLNIAPDQEDDMEIGHLEEFVDEENL